MVVGIEQKFFVRNSVARRAPGGEAIRDPRQPIHKIAVPGRNDLCPCGSGKKFKRCHGAPSETAH